MKIDALRVRLLADFEALPGQLQAAAKCLLDRPHDVALLSMRELTKRINVPPATMTRLAQRLGFSGYEALRTVFADALRDGSTVAPERFRRRAEGLISRRAVDGDGALVTDTLAGLAGQLRALSAPESTAAIAQAADLIVARDRLFCVGARSSYPAIYLASYLMSLIGEETFLVDGAGGIGLDRLRSLKTGDAVLALSIAPYTQNTVEAVAFAHERQAAIIAVTDSHASPIARDACAVIIVPTETPSFLHTMTPAFAVVECLAALVATKLGKSALCAIETAEAHLDRFSSYATEPQPRSHRKTQLKLRAHRVTRPRSAP